MNKKTFFILFVLLTGNRLCYGTNTYSICDKENLILLPKTDTLVPFFSGLNLSHFSGKPVDSFLLKIPINYTSMQIGLGDQMKKAHFLYIKYAGGVNLGIYIKEFRFMDPNPPAGNWNMTLFRKENIDRIEIYNGVVCINGCL